MWIRHSSSRRRALSTAPRFAVAAIGLTVLSISAGAAAAPVASPLPGRADPRTAPANPIPVTYGIGTATKGRADQRSDLNYSVSPGARLADEVLVVNRSSSALTLSVYTADAINGANGAITYQPRANPGRDARTWITLHLPHGATTIAVPARHSTVVPIDVHVPSNATPGDHLAGIRVAMTAKATTRNGKSFDFEQGVALPTHLRVGGGLNPQLSVEHLTASYHGTANPVGSGHTSVSYTVHNTGNVSLGAEQRVSVSNLFGEHGPRARLAAVPTLLPGNSYTVRLDVPGTYPAFALTARVRLTPKAVDTLVDTPLRPVDVSAGLLAVPWALIVSLLILAALVAGVLLWRRAHPKQAARHQRSQRHRAGAAAAVGKA